jgi:hypothetical protein
VILLLLLLQLIIIIIRRRRRRRRRKEEEEKDDEGELANEICAMWKQNTAQVIPSVIPSTAVIPKSLSQRLQRLNLHPNTYIQMQKSVILGTCSIVRNFFKLQIRPPSLLLLITYPRIGECFPHKAEK